MQQILSRDTEQILRIIFQRISGSAQKKYKLNKFEQS